MTITNEEKEVLIEAIKNRIDTLNLSVALSTQKNEEALKRLKIAKEIFRKLTGMYWGEFS